MSNHADIFRPSDLPNPTVAPISSHETCQPDARSQDGVQGDMTSPSYLLTHACMQSQCFVHSRTNVPSEDYMHSPAHVSRSAGNPSSSSVYLTSRTPPQADISQPKDVS